MKREPFNPLQLNAKTGVVLAYECTECWALVEPQRTESHAKWHVRQEKLIKGGNSDITSEGDEPVEVQPGDEVEPVEEQDDLDRRIAEVQAGQPDSGQRPRRDPRRSGTGKARAN